MLLLHINKFNAMRLIITSLFVFSFFCIQGQTGPGGVGNSTNNTFWLNAAGLGLTDGQAVETWTDQSGNANSPTQGTVGSRPTYRTNHVNGHASIEFDGVDDHLDFGSLISTQAATLFFVFQNNNLSYSSLLAIESHHISNDRNTFRGEFGGGNFSVAKPISSFSISGISTESNLASGNLEIYNGSTLTSHSRGSLFNIPNNSIGALFYTGSYKFLFEGEIAEIILYNEQLNSAKRRIVSAYLGGKYNLTSETAIYGFNSTHGNEVIGIGQESDGSHTNSEGTGTLTLSNASGLSDNEYLVIGNNNAGYGTNANVPTGLIEKWDQVWRADETGNVGTVNLEFSLGANGFASPTEYVILLETVDGDFTNGGTSVLTGGTYSVGNNSITFTGVDLPDNAYFTIAEASGIITAVASTDWDLTSTWNCTCIPGTTDIVSIPNSITVHIDSKSDASILTIDNGGILVFDSSDTLNISRNLIINGTLTSNSGTVSASGTTDLQNFSNGSGNRIDFNNLYVNNPNGLSLLSGGWSISNNLQVSAGGLDVSSADSIVLISDASKTMQILQSMSNAFTGDFIVQRFISARPSNYINLGSPITSATAADLDDDLNLSGISGNNGNATTGTGNTFFSIYGHSYLLEGPVTSTTETLLQGIGYEVYLFDDLTNFNGGTVDFIGTPTSGEASTNVLTLATWNLFSNPFQAHIAYDSVDKVSHVPDDYYIFNSSTGTYEFFTGTGKPLIAPGQAFWINSVSSGKSFKVKEEDKVNSTSSSILRRKQEGSFGLKLKNNTNNYSHQLHINFDENSINELDNSDSPFLPSPLEDAPAIYSVASNSDEKLIFNSLSIYESSHLVPIEIDAGIESNYTISSENINKLYNNYNCVYLKDKMEQKVIDFSVENTYDFHSRSGKSNRFELILSNDYYECQDILNNGTFVKDLTHKISLRNSNRDIFIDYTFGEDFEQIEINIFNLQGQLVANPSIRSANGAGSIMIEQLQGLNGIYLIQIRTSTETINKKIKL